MAIILLGKKDMPFKFKHILKLYKNLTYYLQHLAVEIEDKMRVCCLDHIRPKYQTWFKLS